VSWSPEHTGADCAPSVETDRTELVADGLMKVQEAAEFLRLSRSSLYAMMDAGELAFVKLGRSRRIPKRALVELAARELRGGLSL
jgi:excisionase family DNA binding protein